MSQHVQAMPTRIDPQPEEPLKLSVRASDDNVFICISRATLQLMFDSDQAEEFADRIRAAAEQARLNESYSIVDLA